VSDLQCPATVLVVRHGESEGNLSRRLSSAAPGSALSARGRQQARELAAALRDRRVSCVYTSELRRAEQTGQEMADVLGVGVRTLPGVQEVGIGSREEATSDAAWDEMDGARVSWQDGDLSVAVGGGETAEDVVRRMGEALDSVADQHRGETVVVVSHAVAMEVALPRLTRSGRTLGGRHVPNAGVVELERDADGWRLLRWPEPPRYSIERLVHLLGRAEAAVQRLTGGSWSEVAGAVCTALPVPQPWATRATFTASPEPPSPEQVREAVAWCERTSPGCWQVVVRGEHAAAVLAGAEGTLRVDDALYVRAATAVADVPAVRGLEVGPARDADEFLRAYWPGLEPLVRGRVGERGLGFLVGRFGDEVVACARLCDAGGMSHVSGVRVLPEYRHRGIGRAVSAQATRLGLHRHEVAWLHCEPDLAPLYESLGYQAVTTHVHLGPVTGVTCNSSSQDGAVRRPLA
jgi:2,3-bisphosphoglycerate-dependent phosphoglycerate mutase